MSTRQQTKGNKVLVALLAGICGLFFLAGPPIVVGADYPSNPINIISGNPPGGFLSISAQIFADAAKKYLPKSQFVVQFKPGASTAISADYVAKQPADGYTILWLSMSLIGKMAEEEGKLGFNKDSFDLAGMFVKTPFVMPYNTEKAKAKTLDEFIAMAKKRPGEVVWGSTGFGSGGHITSEIFRMKTGVVLNQIPFKGAAEAKSALMGGHVETMFTTIPSVVAQLKPGGGLGLYAIMSDKRWPAYPNVPTLLEKGIDIDRYMWVAMALRKGTPPAVLKTLEDLLNKVEADPEVLTKMNNLGYIPAHWGAAEARRILDAEYQVCKEVLSKP